MKRIPIGVELCSGRQKPLHMDEVAPTKSLDDFNCSSESRASHDLTPEQMQQVIAELTPRQVFDTEDAAKYLCVSKQLLELLRVRGDGPRYVKLHRLVRYRRESLDEWLIQQERCHTSELRPAVRGLRCQKSNLEKL